jgi:hypothetical protein
MAFVLEQSAYGKRRDVYLPWSLIQPIDRRRKSLKESRKVLWAGGAFPYPRQAAHAGQKAGDALVGRPSDDAWFGVARNTGEASPGRF